MISFLASRNQISTVERDIKREIFRMIAQDVYLNRVVLDLYSYKDELIVVEESVNIF